MHGNIPDCDLKLLDSTGVEVEKTISGKSAFPEPGEFRYNGITNRILIGRDRPFQATIDLGHYFKLKLGETYSLNLTMGMEVYFTAGPSGELESLTEESLKVSNHSLIFLGPSKG